MEKKLKCWVNSTQVSRGCCTGTDTNLGVMIFTTTSEETDVSGV